MKTIRVKIDDEAAEMIAAGIDDAHPTLNAVARRMLLDNAHQSIDQLGFRICTCEELQRLAEEQGSPAVFDPVTNEFSLVRHLPGGRAEHVIRFCIECGGRAPASKRANLFARLEHEEVGRLASRCASIHTFKDAFETLGPPTFDWADGVASITRGENGAEEWSTKRVIRYDNLSETASVHFTQRLGDLVSVSFLGKQLCDAQP